jgi:hypothetical protein
MGSCQWLANLIDIQEDFQYACQTVKASLPNFITLLLVAFVVGYTAFFIAREMPSGRSAIERIEQLPPTVTQSPRDHAEAAASLHLFGTIAPSPLRVPAVADSPYKVDGIACAGDGEHCDDQQAAVAMLSGPSGETTAQVGSKLATGETVTRIDPYAVTLSSGTGESVLKLQIPTASTDELTASLPVDGVSFRAVVEAAKSPEPNKVLTQNMGALQAALKAAQERRKTLEGKTGAPTTPPPQP